MERKGYERRIGRRGLLLRERKGREEGNRWKAGRLRTNAGEEERKRKVSQDRDEPWRKVGHREMDKTRMRGQ